MSTPSFPLQEILQHYGQTGKTGMFIIKSDNQQAAIYLMSGIVAHAETELLSSESAMWDILSWEEPHYEWMENEKPERLTMSATVQDMLLKSIQMVSSGELEAVKKAAKEEKTNPKGDTDNDVDAKYLMTLDISSAELRPFRYVIKNSQVRVGRASDNELVLPDTSVSRRHAVLIVNHDAILVRDLGSMNGIKVDGETVTQGLLKNNQTLLIGEVTCKVIINKVKKAPSS